MAYDTVAYSGGESGPGNLASHIADIQGSGLTTLILWALHIGRPSLPGQHYGDYLDLEIDMDTGIIKNWKVPTADQVEEWIAKDQS